MNEKEIPIAIIIFLPIIILLLEVSVHGLSILWDWFISKDNQD